MLPSFHATCPWCRIHARLDLVKKARLAEAAREQEYSSYEGVVAGFIEKAPIIVVPVVTSFGSNQNMVALQRRTLGSHGD